MTTLELGDALKSGYTTLRLPPVTEEAFEAFCHSNPDWNVERDGFGELIILPPPDAYDESRRGDIYGQVGLWSRTASIPGLSFGSSAGFRLPNGATRAPDVSWVSRARWDSVPVERRHPFPHLCPEFVVEVLSPSDALTTTQAKMEEYRANGALLGWLIDTQHRQVHVYRPGQAIEILNDPSTLSGEPELPGFVADLSRVFLADE